MTTPNSSAPITRTSTSEDTHRHYVGTWATTLRAAADDYLRPKFRETLLVQTVRVSAGGSRVRLLLSNCLGESELVIGSASLALLQESDGNATFATAQQGVLRFNREEGVTLPAGEDALSDPLDFELPPMADLVIRLHIKKAPKTLSGHDTAFSVSRSFHRPAASDADSSYEQVNRWYFISSVYTLPATTPRGLVLLGDSITDGGVPPSAHQRWSDVLSRRLRSNPATADIGVLNQGISGNGILSGGPAIPGLDRFERDVLRHPGVRWVIIYLGINDVHFSGSDARPVSDLLAAYRQMIDRAHAVGIKVYGATLMPSRGCTPWNTITEERRQALNDWIRNSGQCDAVIDFDAALRDPIDPSYLTELYDNGDFLHPSAAGFEAMGQAVDLNLFIEEN